MNTPKEEAIELPTGQTDKRHRSAIGQVGQRHGAGVVQKIETCGGRNIRKG